MSNGNSMSLRLSNGRFLSAMRRLSREYGIPQPAKMRWLAAGIALSVGVPRLPVVHDVMNFGVQRFGSSDVWGWVLTLLGVMLLVTCYRWRLHIFGRMVALVGLVLFAGLIWSTQSDTSKGVELFAFIALLWEAGTQK